jgi:hypothetical protein
VRIEELDDDELDDTPINDKEVSSDLREGRDNAIRMIAKLANTD